MRILAICLAMISDTVDGYLARRYKSTSRFGAILDPAMDKFFVYFALTVLLTEGKIGPWETLAMLSRDFFLFFYGLFMLSVGRWKSVVFRAIRWGKITTALQFFLLIGLTLGLYFPWYFYALLPLMGFFAFLELIQYETSQA